MVEFYCSLFIIGVLIFQVPITRALHEIISLSVDNNYCLKERLSQLEEEKNLLENGVYNF